jgi:hypothetical protein
MAWAYLQSVQNNNATASVAKAIIPHAIGNLLIATAWNTAISPTQVFSISDTAGNTWQPLLVSSVPASTRSAFAWYAISVGNVSTTVTCNVTTTSAAFQLLIDEFSGNDTSASVFQSFNSSAKTSAPATSSLSTITGPGDALIWSACISNTTEVADVTFTHAGTGGSNTTQSEYKALVGQSNTAQVANWTGTAGSQTILFVACFNISGFVAPVGITVGTLSPEFVFFDTGQYSLGV